MTGTVESFVSKHGEFLTLATIILGGFYFTTSHLSHRIDRIEDHIVLLEGRVNGIEKEVYMMKGIMVYNNQDTKE